VRLQNGESATVINPTPSATNVEFIRQQIAAVSANMVPYHLMTGDVSQANYSGLRAAMNGSYALVDDWQQNDVIPLLCRPMVTRRMRRLAFETGDRRYLDVRASFALPVRRLVDPIKDLMGEIMEIRAGLKLISKGLAERGINAEDHMRQIAEMNTLIDTLGLALDSDPRRLTDSGVLQAAAGYIAPKGDQAQN
jgi:capsid protein